MPDPFTTAALVQLGSAALGAGASKLFGPDDDVPDLVSPQRRGIDRQRRIAEERRNRLFDRIRGDARARGLSSSQETAATQAAIGETNEDISRLESRAAEIIGDTVNRQRLLEFQRNSAKRQAINQGIMEGLQGVSGFFATRGLLDGLNQAPGQNPGGGSGGVPDLTSAVETTSSPTIMRRPSTPSMSTIADDPLFYRR